MLSAPPWSAVLLTKLPAVRVTVPPPTPRPPPAAAVLLMKRTWLRVSWPAPWNKPPPWLLVWLKRKMTLFSDRRLGETLASPPPLVLLEKPLHVLRALPP